MTDDACVTLLAELQARGLPALKAEVLVGGYVGVAFRLPAQDVWGAALDLSDATADRFEDAYWCAAGAPPENAEFTR